MDSTAGFALRPVDQGIDVEKFVVNKPDRFKTGCCRGKVRTSDQEIDVARIADGVFIYACDPLCNGVATDHRVGDPGRVEARVALRSRSLTFSAAMSARSQPMGSTAASAMTKPPSDFLYRKQKHEVW